MQALISKSADYLDEYIFSQNHVFKYKLDWANSAPTYPQTGHHSRHRF